MSTIGKPHGWEMPGEPGEVSRIPVWKDAVTVFLDTGYAPGDIIPHAWFYEQFGIVRPHDCPDYATARKAQLAYLDALSGLKAELLEEHQIALRTARGVGYEVVPPQEQTEWAEDSLKADLRKALHTSKARLVNVRLDELSDDQKKQNLDAQARLSFFRKQARKALA